MGSKITVALYVRTCILLCLPIVGCAIGAGGGTYASASRDSIARELTASAYSVLNASNFRVTNDAAESLRRFIGTGAGRIDDSQLDTARQNIKTFAEKLVANSSFDEWTGGRKVDSGSFQAALSLCPLYPFC